MSSKNNKRAVITAEGPLFQFRNRGYLSGLKQGSGLALFLEAWTEVYMLQVHSTCSGCVLLFGVLNGKGLLIFASEGKNDQVTLVMTKCKESL